MCMMLDHYYPTDMHYTDISLLWGKYTRMFVPRFPGIPEMLYFPTPQAPADPWDIISNVARTVKYPSLVQNGAIPKAGNITFAVSGHYKVTQYFAHLCICEVKTVQNILRGFL